MQSFRSRRSDLGRARAHYLAALFGRELRLARVAAGLTQVQVGRIAGVGQMQVSRAERGRLEISLDARCRLAAACGHEVGWRLHPVATVRLRDSGQMEVAQVIVSAAHPSWCPRLEVPLAPGDARAADLLLVGEEETIHIEIERALVDFQAQLRQAQVKREALAARDGRPMRLVIAVPDTGATRQRLAPFASLIAQTMPATSREIWRAIRTSEPLPADGILFVRTPRRPLDSAQEPSP